MFKNCITIEMLLKLVGATYRDLLLHLSLRFEMRVKHKEGQTKTHLKLLAVGVGVH